jgi:hypothetical protein
MELLSVIRRWHDRDHFSIRGISRRTGLSRNTVGKYLRSDSEEPKFSIPERPSRLDPYADKLSHRLRQEAGTSRKQKRTIKPLHADLVVLGYEGSYNINEMSNACGRCRYDPHKSVGDDACPFTTLYWEFLARHERRFAINPRMKYPYLGLAKKDPRELALIRRQADALKNRLTRETFL